MNTSVSNTTESNDPDSMDVRFRQYRAPRKHGESFVEPSIGETSQLLASNQSTLENHGSHWHAMRTDARAKLIADAIKYTSVYRDTNWVDRNPNRPILMAGHQPSLFHPGVWFKNFSLSQLGERLGGTAVNLVVDNDVAKGSAIRVPTIDSSTGLASANRVAYDDFGGGVPYEQTTVGNLDRFDRFDVEVARVVKPLVSDPCVHQLWPHARSAINRCGVAGCALAQARHGLEGEIGLKSLELPLGVVCRSRPFIEFALGILSELPRFSQCYNDSADLYRAAHRIRSSAHPVPNLSEQEGWFEAPFWIYGNQSPNRKAAWARLNGDCLELSDLGNRLVKIETANLSDSVDQFAAAMTPEFKIRPRALLTTMYSRLVLSDLFLHGIGGGKYDQLGDMITKSYFGITPPKFMVLSATIHLPNVRPSDATNRVRQLKRQIRETHFQGERFSSELTAHSGLVQQKKELLDVIPPRGSRPAWHREITAVNLKLSDALSDARADLQKQLLDAQREVNAQSILESREHPFCVYPIEYLMQNFERLSA